MSGTGSIQVIKTGTLEGNADKSGSCSYVFNWKTRTATININTVKFGWVDPAYQTQHVLTISGPPFGPSTERDIGHLHNRNNLFHAWLQPNLTVLAKNNGSTGTSTARLSTISGSYSWTF